MHSAANIKIATPEVMQRIQDVIRETSVPTWITTVPPKFGEASTGTLKADEWRSLATIYLPIALISMWGKGSTHQSEQHATTYYRILDHTMLLVGVVTLACFRKMTTTRGDAFLACMKQYLSDLPKLHPGTTFKPNHHMTMHLPHFFKLFGPARGWWCFPFERTIGQVQRLLSNHKLGRSAEALDIEHNIHHGRCR